MAAENDIVLIYLEDEPLVFARVEEIHPDVKKDWYHIKLMLLQLPVQVVTWILKDDYINGAEFTMGGRRMRLETIEPPEETQLPPQEDTEAGAEKTSGNENAETQAPGDSKVISLQYRKPKSPQ